MATVTFDWSGRELTARIDRHSENDKWIFVTVTRDEWSQGRMKRFAKIGDKLMLGSDDKTILRRGA